MFSSHKPASASFETLQLVQPTGIAFRIEMKSDSRFTRRGANGSPSQMRDPERRAKRIHLNCIEVFDRSLPSIF
jgi:hypothetical protein